ncbi:uncharacterized protein [Lolium perenne]|uniref:uncharacterized protein n=1 Tax=Lolium perenne TaxID=4522 RepID=UPI003A99F3E0
MAPPQLTTPRPSETTRSSVSSPRPCSSKESSRRSLNHRQTRRFPSPATTHQRDFRPPPTSSASVEVFISILLRHGRRQASVPHALVPAGLLPGRRPRRLCSGRTILVLVSSGCYTVQKRFELLHVSICSISIVAGWSHAWRCFSLRGSLSSKINFSKQSSWAVPFGSKMTLRSIPGMHFNSCHFSQV